METETQNTEDKTEEQDNFNNAFDLGLGNLDIGLALENTWDESLL